MTLSPRRRNNPNAAEYAALVGDVQVSALTVHQILEHALAIALSDYPCWAGSVLTDVPEHRRILDPGRVVADLLSDARTSTTELRTRLAGMAPPVASVDLHTARAAATELYLEGIAAMQEAGADRELLVASFRQAQLAWQCFERARAA